MGTVLGNNMELTCFLTSHCPAQHNHKTLNRSLGRLKKAAVGDLKRHGSLEFEGAVKAEKFGFINSLQCACFLTRPPTQMCLEWRDPFTAGFMGTEA